MRWSLVTSMEYEMLGKLLGAADYKFEKGIRFEKKGKGMYLDIVALDNSQDKMFKETSPFNEETFDVLKNISNELNVLNIDSFKKYLNMKNPKTFLISGEFIEESNLHRDYAEDIIPLMRVLKKENYEAEFVPILD